MIPEISTIFDVMTQHYIFFINQTQCTECPENSADCYGNTIIVSPGYWRINQYGVTLIECPYGTVACIGGDGMSVPPSSRKLSMSSTFANISSQYIGICEVGYEGPLCGVCSPHYYFSSSSKTCNTCQDGRGINQLATMIIVPLILLFVVMFLTFSSFLANDISKDGYTNGLVNVMVLHGDDTQEGSSELSKVIKEKGLKKWVSNLVHIMTPKVKIMLTVYQIISNLPFALNIEYTKVAAKLFYAFRWVLCDSCCIIASEYIDLKQCLL